MGYCDVAGCMASRVVADGMAGAVVSGMIGGVVVRVGDVAEGAVG